MKNGLITVKRIICCKIPVLFRARQMWWSNSAQNVFNRLNSLSRSRKIILVILVVLALIYYLGFFNLRRSTGIKLSFADGCIEDKINKFHKQITSFDVVANHKVGGEDTKFYPPYVGNGKIAVSVDSRNGLYIRLNRALSLPVKFYPVVGITLQNDLQYQKRASSLLDIKSGLAYKIQAFEMGSGWGKHCVTIGSQVYAHRSRPSILIQSIKITNPTKSTVKIELDQVGSSGWDGAISNRKSGNNYIGETVHYTVTTGVVKTNDPAYVVLTVIATTQIPDKLITIQKSSRKTLSIITVVHYSEPISVKNAGSKTALDQLMASVEKDMTATLKIDPKELREEHIKVWQKIWKSGFGISQSKASSALNGDKINTTIYYVLSNIPAPLHDISTSAQDKTAIMKTLYYPDRCYGGHTTLESPTLWVDVTDEEDISRVVTTWMITLEKQGCSVMVQAGAEGVLQAMMLSIGSFRFGNDHLEFGMEPKDLHRDMFFHRLNYGNNTHLNISVIVGKDNKANIYVALDRNDKPYYACDAGCIDPPAGLSKELKQFPVKLTKPLTSILYITADKIHMEELKHAIHVKEIIEAPAHEHHVIALHKHGHHFGGLPTIFWVSIAFLVIIFHLFLFKLIYNEYCAGQDRFSRGRYSV